MNAGGRAASAGVRTEASSHEAHPRALAPANLVLTVLLSVIGAIVGIHMVVSLGITPSTSLVGALAAMALARVPLKAFREFRSPHAQNLAQTSISSATFGAANSLFLPIGIPFLFGLPEMVAPMLIGVSLAMLLDGWLLYRLFGSEIFPARNPWPLGVAAAEAIKAGDSGGRDGRLLLGGLAVGVVGSICALPMAAFGVALIGGLAAMTAFGVGLLVKSYALSYLNIDLARQYIPHGLMMGAGVTALMQVTFLVFKRSSPSPRSDVTEEPVAPVGRTLRFGAIGYLLIMVVLALATGVYMGMSLGMLAFFVLYGAFAAFVHEIIVGIAAMHAGWFPAFAVALITLLVGILLGLPPQALVVLAGFSAATGPAFADMGYDLKAGYLLRGEGADRAFEREGRLQQTIAGMVGFGVAIVVVALTYQTFFSNGQTAPINAAYVAAIKAGISGDTARNLLVWAIPGALLQLVGGSRRQLGVLLATGLLIGNPLAGWMVAAGLATRLLAAKVGKASGKSLEVFAGGVIAGDALHGFVHGLYATTRK
ncbi:hypothetical protein CDN99_19580 [Roseateles aquatilis]|uniref:OPT family oligopeptide transporter n=1 Tax=Roseateles aquatilis TaxID=431061 RepID=A0A246J4B7_9BURK|nr:hypothetical protein CDN99_19580 [Roseateles aquatilis]